MTTQSCVTSETSLSAVSYLFKSAQDLPTVRTVTGFGKDTMTSRADLQGKTINDLRSIATAIGIGPDGLQKAKLIDAILGSDNFDSSEAPAPVELPAASPKVEAKDSSDAGEAKSSRGSQAKGKPTSDNGSSNESDSDSESDDDSDSSANRDSDDSDDNQQGGEGNRSRNRNRNRKRNRGPRDTQPDIPESEMETREGLLDILPEGYGFLRCSGYRPGDLDVYVSASQVRKFGLRRGDMVAGPVRPPRSQEKFAALVRIESVSGMDVETARKRPKFDKLTPLFPDERLRLEEDGKPSQVLTQDHRPHLADRQGPAWLDRVATQGR